MIVDDHALFRNGLKLLLNAYDNLNVVAEASNGIEFLSAIDVINVDLVLLDIEMPEMGGIEAAQLALEKFPDLKIITLSMYGDEEYYYRMVEAGVSGFLLKDSDIDEVYAAICSVVEGKNYFSQVLLQNLINTLKSSGGKHKDSNGLTDREIEIVSFVCKGLSNAEISEQLFLSKRTVEKHRANILEKTNTRNTASLVMYAIRNHIVKV